MTGNTVDIAPVVDRVRADHFSQEAGGHYSAGTHLIIEVKSAKGLDDKARIERAFRACIAATGSTLLHLHLHRFQPHGVSGVAVLAESHITIHTWPELGYGAFDVFMCGKADPWRTIDVLAQAFETRDIEVKEISRGLGVIVER
ncbi:MAG: adenosylmethionine decarboxylase [Silicimonas sp.]|nr:adenosylmethionine decarboxylase [Silicimonas sp.]